MADEEHEDVLEDYLAELIKKRGKEYQARAEAQQQLEQYLAKLDEGINFCLARMRERGEEIEALDERIEAVANEYRRTERINANVRRLKRDE